MKKFYQLLVLTATTALSSFAIYGAENSHNNSTYGFAIYNDFKTAKPSNDFNVYVKTIYCNDLTDENYFTLIQGNYNRFYWDANNHNMHCGGFKLPYTGVVVLYNQSYSATLTETINASGKIELTKQCPSIGNLVCGNIETYISGNQVNVYLKLNG